MKYEYIRLKEIDLAKLKLVKEVVVWFDDQDHSRWVCRTTKHSPLDGVGAAYIKIWNPTYVRRDNILRAMESGFYDMQTTPALKGILFHQGVCRGYVMQPCRRNRTLDPDFYALIKRKTAVTSYFHVQFSRFHVYRFKDTFSLIDLEGVYPLWALPQLSHLHSVFDCPDYEVFVHALYRKWYRSGEEGSGPFPSSPKPPLHHPNRERQLWRKPLALYRSWRRQIGIKWETLRHNMDLIER